MTELRFDDRVVVVTGGGRGIGRAHARLLAARGARVVVADVDAADEVAGEIQRAGGAAVAITASVADDRAASIIEAALDSYGRLDAVINNAGTYAPAAFDTLSLADFREMFEVHFFGTVRVTMAAWPHLAAARSGRVLNTVSEGMFGVRLWADYGAAKGAVFGFTRNLALEGAPLGIAVNAISPRAYTRMADAYAAARGVPVDEGLAAAGLAAMPPEQVAPAAAFLVHESCTLNGEVLLVGSGRVRRVAAVLSPGITAEALTPEDVASGIDRVLDLADARLIGLDGVAGEAR